MKKVLVFAFLILSATAANSQLVLNNTASAAALVANLIGPGVTATNITYTGSPSSKATFTCSGGCNLGFPSGVMLTSGSASGTTAPASYWASTGMGTAGDAQLDAIVNPQATQDAAVLEFDFTIASDSVKFEYVFGSEEYNDWVNTSFNDVFAFYISGPGITGIQNMAIVPNTAIPVSINNINNGGPTGGTSSGPCTNCAYYVDNVNGTSFFLDGYTTSLVAKAKIQPCQVYHMKLAIADVSDGAYDSGVFLKAGSFTAIGPVTVTANGAPIGNGGYYYACTGTSVTLCLTQNPTYQWSTGATTQCITVNEQNITANGMYEAIFTGPGCFGYSQVHVEFLSPSATITPSGSLALCPGGNVTLSANPGNTFLWSNGATTQSINVTAPGTYTVTVSLGPNCSATSTPVTVTIGNPTAQISGVLSLCNGANTTLTANAGQSYLWNTGATTQAINVGATGNYTVTVTQPGGCTANATVNVQVNPSPVPAITGNLSICQGASTILDAGPGYSNYLWSNGLTTQTISATANGTYTVTVTNATTCTASTSAIVTVNALPTPVITGVTSFCVGANTTISVGPGYSSYLWNNGVVTQTLPVSAAGTYTVTVTNANNCSASTNTVVTVNPLPTPNITGSFAFCQGGNTTIDAGLGYTTYLWSTGGGLQTINVATGNTYTVTVTDANGCTNTDSQLITVNPNPVPAITGTLSICQGANTILTASPAGLPNYTWSTGGTGSTLNVNSAGPYSVIVTDANGCTGTTATNVVVNPLPTPAISGTLTFCNGGGSTLNAGNGYSSYLWNNGLTTQTIPVTASGNYTVTVTNANNCSASTSATVVANPLPVPAISGALSFCQGSNTTLNATPGFASYLWNTGAVTPNITVTNANTFTVTVADANGCTGTISKTTVVNPNPVPVISGTNVICQGQNTSFSPGPGYATYAWSTGASTQSVNLNTGGTYTVTVSDANGCLGTTSSVLTVNPLPTPAITGTTTFCQGLNSNLNAGGGFTSYLWNTGTTTQIQNVTASGNYTVTVTNAFNCSASTSTPVVVNPLPVPAITGPTAICIGATATLNAGNGYATYLWNNGATTQTINSGAAGTFTVTVSSAAGCSATTSSSLIVNPLPTPSITGITTICQGATTPLDAGVGYASYAWSTGATTQTINAGIAGPVTVTVTDANGCSSPATTSITVNPLPTPVISGVNAFCAGGSSVIDAGAGYSTYLWNTGATSRTINVNTAGNYTVTVSANTGCSGIDSELITVHSNPVPAISGNTNICQGASTTLNAGNGYATYLWNNGSTTQTIPVSTAGNYTVTVTSAFGCIGSVSASTVVNPLPTPAITGITAICQGTTTTFNAGAGYNGYLWSNGATTQTIAPGIAGTYTVTVTDANACSNNTNISLVVNALPVPAITGTNAFCAGDNSNLNAGAGYSGYLWSNGSSTQVINVNTAGNYIVTVTDNNGCTANTNMAITVHPNPTPVINGGTGICQGTTTALNVPGTYSTYLWNTGATTSNITVGTAGNYSVTVTSAFGCIGSTSTAMVINPLPTPIINGTTAICQGTTTSFDAGSGYSAYLWSNGSTTQTIAPGIAGSYTVTVTDANGCQNNTDIALVVNALPTPVITGDFAFCQNDNSNINAGSGYVNYLWSNGSSTQVINVTTAGNYSVTVTDNNGCSSSTSTLITVHALPIPNITGDNTICDGTTTTFSAGNYSSYVWSDGSTNGTLVTGAAGTYNVTVTDANGCMGSTSEILTVYDLPVATISGTTAICIGASTSVSFDFTGTAPFNYTYSNGTLTSPVLTSNVPSVSVNVNPANTTTYTLITISDANCTGLVAGTAEITINPLPLPLITGDLAICDGETTTLSANAGYASYDWSNSGSQSSISTGNAGIYTVTVVDINGCVGTSPAVNLIVNTVPVVSFTNDTSLTCAVPKINFTNLSSYDSGSQFAWNFGDGGESNDLNPSHYYLVPGTFPVSLVITTPAGCVSSSTTNVDIMFYPLPVADFVTSPPVSNVYSGKIGFVDRSSNAISWNWEFGDGARSIEQNPSHYFNDIGEYKVRLTITNIAGCEDSHEEVVNINPFFIPNAFTPNGDGVNDVFYYSGYDLDVETYDMNIFNRWGQLVFEGAGENDNWTGETSTGDIAPQGTYVYRLRITTKGGEEHVYNGHVNLIR